MRGGECRWATGKNPVQGYHLTLDCWDVTCHPGDVESFIRGAVAITGLHLIKVRDDKTGREQEALTIVEGRRSLWGWLRGEPVPWAAGLGMIAESHISAHIHGSFGYLDVFSCAPFPWSRVISIAGSCFGGKWRVTYRRRSVRDEPGD